MRLLLANSELKATVNSELFSAHNSLMKYPEYAARFKKSWKESPTPVKTQKELARLLGVAQATVSDWINGEKLPSMDTAIKISSKLGCSTEWLLTGKGQKELTQLSAAATVSPKTTGTIVLGGFDFWDDDTPLDDDEVALPFFREVELSAGSGRHQVIENYGKKLRFAKSTLKKSNVTASNAACVTVSGNSMEPAMPNGATIGIDTSIKEIINGEIYAIDHDGDLRVKIVFRMPGGVIRLRSFNIDDWPDENYSVEEAAKIEIIGRVFWWSVLR